MVLEVFLLDVDDVLQETLLGASVAQVLHQPPLHALHLRLQGGHCRARAVFLSGASALRLPGGLHRDEGHDEGHDEGVSRIDAWGIPSPHVPYLVGEGNT